MIIALQNFVVFCHTSRISHRYTSVPSLPNSPHISLLIPPFQTITEPLFESPESHSKFSFSSVQLLSRVWLFATPGAAACQVSLFFTISRSLLKLMFIESVMPSNHLILWHPLLLLSIFPSIRSALGIRWPKFWSFSFSISPFKEYSVLISFKIDWFDLFAF